MLEKEVIDMVEIVKKVADVTEKVSSDVAEALPADSDLKKIVIEVEGEAEVVCVDAEKTETFIHKVVLYCLKLPILILFFIRRCKFLLYAYL